MQTANEYESLLEDTAVFDPKDQSSMRVNYGVMLYKAASVATHQPHRVRRQAGGHLVNRTNWPGNRGSEEDTTDEQENDQVDIKLALMSAAMQLWSNEVYALQVRDRVASRVKARLAVNGQAVDGQGETWPLPVVPTQNVHASLEQVKHIVRKSELIAAQHLADAL
jgi:hypothetical protein